MTLTWMVEWYDDVGESEHFGSGWYYFGKLTVVYVGLPSKNGDFHSCDSLPEGIWTGSKEMVNFGVAKVW